MPTFATIRDIKNGYYARLKVFTEEDCGYGYNERCIIVFNDDTDLPIWTMSEQIVREYFNSPNFKGQHAFEIPANPGWFNTDDISDISMSRYEVVCFDIP